MPENTLSTEAAAYLAAIVDSSDDAIVSKNLSGIIQTWNKGAERIFGYAAQEAIGQPVLLIIPPDLHHEEQTILTRLRNGERIEHFETVRRRKDGALIHISLTISPVRDATGNIIGASKVARDITDRKRAEQAIAEAQARLAITLQCIGDAVLATDLQARITYVNPVAEELLGYSAHQAIERPLADVFRIVNQETRRTVESPVHRVIRDDVVVGLANHTVLLRPDGTELPIDDSAAPIRTSDGKVQGVVLVFRDVTERYNADRQAALLSAIVSSSDDAIMSKDLFGTITSWNRGAERIYGYTAQEIIGRSILTLIPSERHGEEARILSRLRAAERLEHYETVRRTKSGDDRDISMTVSPLFDDEGRVVGASAIARDITDQKRERQRLFEAEERWRVTLESIGDAVIATDAHTIVTFANHVAAGLLGRTSQVLVGRPLKELFTIVSEDTRRTVESPVDRVIREGVVVGLANHTLLIRPDGSEVPIDDSAAPIRNRDGRLVGAVLAFRDITARKQAEARQRQWHSELEQQVQERTHELVRSQERLRGLATQLSMTEQRERRRLATELHDHLQQLLVLAQMQIGQGKRFSLDLPDCERVLKKADEVLSEALTYTRTLVAELSPPALRDHGLSAGLKWLGESMKKHDLAVTVRTDDDKAVDLPEDATLLLFQSVRELLLNVSKHAGTGEAVVEMARKDRDLTISVRDQGVGFEPAAMKSPPTADTSSKFGLFSIRERMRAVGGSLNIRSEPKKETVAMLTVPLPKDEAAPIMPNAFQVAPLLPRVPSNRRRGVVRVLLVDDHAMVRQGLKSLLSGYRDIEIVGEASNGIEALSAAAAHRPTVVIMDINMPKMDGIEATRRIKSELPDAFVIGLSVNTGNDNVKAMLQAGATALLTKEDVVEHLYTAIQKVVKQDFPL